MKNRYIPHLLAVGVAIGVGVTLFAISKNPSLTKEYSTGFSPRGGAKDLVLQVISSCQTSLHLASYDFTSEDIGQALKNASNRVKMSIVADERGSKRHYSTLQSLKDVGISIKVNGHYPIHHNKFIICDGKIVQTGSFNYTKGAERNAENVLVLWNAPEIYNVYRHTWDFLSNEGKELIKLVPANDS